MSVTYHVPEDACRKLAAKRGQDWDMWLRSAEMSADAHDGPQVLVVGVECEGRGASAGITHKPDKIGAEPWFGGPYRKLATVARP